MLDIDISVKVYDLGMTDTTDTAVLPIQAERSARRFPLAATSILSLALAVSVTTESLPAAIMPQMSASLGVGNFEIGMLLSTWAFTIIIASIPLTRLVRHVDRRSVVAGALAVFAIGSLATAIAPTYETMLAARVLNAGAHGLLWSVVIVYTTAILDPKHLGRGLAIVTGGVTVALAVGLPAGAALALVVDWRVLFAAIAVVMLTLAFTVRMRLPSVPPESSADEAAARGTRTDATRAPVFVLLATATIFALGQFTLFTYITPYLSEEAGLSSVWTGPLLTAYGAAGILGLIVSGLVVDRWPTISLPVTFAAGAVAVGLLALAPEATGVVVAAIALWGAAFGAMSPLVQTALMRTASPQLRAFAGAALAVAFNLGIASGSWFGGVLGEVVPITVNAGVAAVASAASVILVLIAQRLVTRAGTTAAE